MKAIVHIGTEKTGSTSIQEYLYKNRQQLIDSGFYFIQSAGKTNNRALPAYCMSDDHCDDFFKNRGFFSIEDKNKFKKEFIINFENEIKSIPNKVHTVIISSEHFHSRTNSQEEVNNVKKLLSSYFNEIKIICYLREQASSCTSLYSTLIKAGSTSPFDKVIQGCTSKKIYYNYYEMLMHWENSFGFESIDLSVFEPSHLLHGDLLDDFIEKISPKLVGTLNRDFVYKNESTTYAGQILSKAINSSFPKYTKELKINPIRDKCQRRVFKHLKGKGEQPSLEIQKNIYNEFSKSNEMVRQKYFPEMETLFKPPLKETPSNKNIDEDFIEVTASIFNVIKKNSREMILPDSYANLFRDTAIRIEQEDIESAFKLMELAHEIRPSGPVIKSKLEEYKNLLENDKCQLNHSLHQNKTLTKLFWTILKHIKRYKWS